jgi:hypothetical protein
VLIFTGIIYILFGIFGKFSAAFITIPYPVLGGAIVVNFGIFFGVILSNLEVRCLPFLKFLYLVHCIKTFILTKHPRE